ncbi:hypothetical protein CAPTEDRAFT_204578 [Capitella teleta]|uniref:Uncharacterized protein n=1 Tax=Capitella teleta TaxID=283909 RepID=R7T691_CAPTE|nr:hypothetical protein CAPTEDRAFT_204578 [Capitella teleta]|eukprot:ELT88778.1 hypothetical protein CAPTEDRAFT_204578 [Capitella teleta]
MEFPVQVMALHDVLYRGVFLLVQCRCRFHYVIQLHVEIGTFLAQQKLPNTALFSDPSWIAQLALLANLTGLLNFPNRLIQGKDILVTDMSTAIQAKRCPFMAKMICSDWLKSIALRGERDQSAISQTKPSADVCLLYFAMEAILP